MPFARTDADDRRLGPYSKRSAGASLVLLRAASPTILRTAGQGSQPDGASERYSHVRKKGFSIGHRISVILESRHTWWRRAHVISQ